MSTDYTPKQIAILRHALGLGADGSGIAYRNYFVTGPGSDDFADCEALVMAGAMTKRQGSEISGGDPVYRVTELGIARATKGGEA